MRRRDKVEVEVLIGNHDLATLCGVRGEELMVKSVVPAQYGGIVVTFGKTVDRYKSPHVHAVRWPRK